VAELDDRLFYRAQHQVRRALLDLGLGDDVFWLPLDDVRAGSLEHLASRADSARRLHAHQQRLWMPAEVRGDERVDRPAGIDRNTLRGRGLGGRARGRVYKLPISRPISTDAIITAVDLTPADALAVRQATGVALEAGSLLGHGAAMARELGIPIVVQIPGLCRIVEDGEPVALDGETGLLVRVRPR
jgi:phosphohistidine swiveling domain-containing protein